MSQPFDQITALAARAREANADLHTAVQALCEGLPDGTRLPGRSMGIISSRVFAQQLANDLMSPHEGHRTRAQRDLSSVLRIVREASSPSPYEGHPAPA